MRTNKISLSLLMTVVMSTAILFSCKKENTYLNSAQKTDASALRSVVGGSQVLTLIPGANDGQDAYVETKADDAGTANANFNYVAELPPVAWTDGGAPIKQRIFINFTGLSAIPQNATVTSATLHLYGLSSSLNAPQGNSTYPGSPYTSFGPNKCVIAQASSAWDETTLTWNTQPGYLTQDAVVFGPSTSQWNWDAEINVTKIVKRMVKYPNKNFGFGIALLNEQAFRSIVFGSSESAENDRPKLVIEYVL